MDPCRVQPVSKQQLNNQYNFQAFDETTMLSWAETAWIPQAFEFNASLRNLSRLARLHPIYRAHKAFASAIACQYRSTAHAQLVSCSGPHFQDPWSGRQVIPTSTSSQASQGVRYIQFWCFPFTDLTGLANNPSQSSLSTTFVGLSPEQSYNRIWHRSNLNGKQ